MILCIVIPWLKKIQEITKLCEIPLDLSNAGISMFQLKLAIFMYSEIKTQIAF